MLYLIFNQGKLFGYTYSLTALRVFNDLTKGSSNKPVPQHMVFTYKKVNDANMLLVCDNLKDEKHIENLVTFYSKMGYDAYYWKYIQYNREVVSKFSYSWMYKFHRLYERYMLDDLNNDLNSI